MPWVHHGCRGLATVKKEAIVIKLIDKEISPFMEIIERHHTLCHKTCYDLRDLFRKYRVADRFAGRSDRSVYCKTMQHPAMLMGPAGTLGVVGGRNYV